jgi:hypothetical protein
MMGISVAWAGRGVKQVGVEGYLLEITLLYELESSGGAIVGFDQLCGIIRKGCLTIQWFCHKL